MSRPSLSLKRTTPQSLSLAVDAFLLDAQARNLAPKSITYYTYQLKAFTDFANSQGLVTLADVTPEVLRGYVLAMQRRRLKGTSQHAAMRAIRAWLNWCVKEGWLASSPMAHVAMPRVERAMLPALDVGEVAQLLDACLTARDRALILCLLDSGCRAAELCALDVSDYDKRSGSVTVRCGKGRKSRTTFFGPQARSELARYLFSRGRVIGSDPLFVNDKRGTRLTVSGLDSLFDRLGKRAGVHCSPHALRRTCALWAHRAGWRLTEIQKLLGHSDLSTLKRYLDLDDDDVRKAHERFSPSDNLKQNRRE